MKPTKTPYGLDHSISFITANIGDATRSSYLGDVPKPAWFVTISRQGGCNAHGIAEHAAELLQALDPNGKPPWTVFDRNLVEEVLKDHHLPDRLRQHMPEDRRSELEDIMGELFDLHPSSWTLVHQTSDTILRLADRGRCIVIGRAANFVTRALSRGLHVRLIGSVEGRIGRMQKYEKLSAVEARKHVREQDRARGRYVHKYFEADISDPAHYHLLINVDHFNAGQTARIIVHALTQRVVET